MNFITTYYNRDWCNWIKLFAAILVAVSHYSTVIVINNQWSDNSFLRFLCQGGYIGVAIFFFLSGYGLMESETKKHLSFKDFLRRRLSKVYIPFLFISFIWMPLYYFFVFDYKNPISCCRVLYDLLWGGRDSVLWFIKILIMMYIVFYAFSLLQRYSNKILSHIVLNLGLLICMFISYYAFGAFSIMSIPLFGIGIYSSLYKKVKIYSFPAVYFMLIMLGFIGLVLYILMHDSVSAHIFVNSFTMIVVVSIVFILNSFKMPKRMLMSSNLVSATYLLYIVHMKVLILMVENLGYISFYSWAIVTIITTILLNRLKLLLKI